MKKLSTVKLSNILAWLEEFETAINNNGGSIVFTDYEVSQSNLTKVIGYLNQNEEFLDLLDYSKSELRTIHIYFGELSPEETKLLLKTLWVENLENLGMDIDSKWQQYQQVNHQQLAQQSVGNSEDFKSMNWTSIIDMGWAIQVDEQNDEVLPGLDMNSNTIYYLLDNGRNIYMTPYFDGVDGVPVEISDEDGDYVGSFILDVPSFVTNMVEFKSWYLQTLENIFIYFDIIKEEFENDTFDIDNYDEYLIKNEESFDEYMKRTSNQENSQEETYNINKIDVWTLYNHIIETVGQTEHNNPPVFDGIGVDRPTVVDTTDKLEKYLQEMKDNADELSDSLCGDLFWVDDEGVINCTSIWIEESDGIVSLGNENIGKYNINFETLEFGGVVEDNGTISRREPDNALSTDMYKIHDLLINDSTEEDDLSEIDWYDLIPEDDWSVYVGTEILATRDINTGSIYFAYEEENLTCYATPYFAGMDGVPISIINEISGDEILRTELEVPTHITNIVDFKLWYLTAVKNAFYLCIGNNGQEVELSEYEIILKLNEVDALEVDWDYYAGLCSDAMSEDAETYRNADYDFSAGDATFSSNGLLNSDNSFIARDDESESGNKVIEISYQTENDIILVFFIEDGQYIMNPAFENLLRLEGITFEDLMSDLDIDLDTDTDSFRDLAIDAERVMNVQQYLDVDFDDAIFTNIDFPSGNDFAMRIGETDEGTIVREITYHLIEEGDILVVHYMLNSDKSWNISPEFNNLLKAETIQGGLKELMGYFNVSTDEIEYDEDLDNYVCGAWLNTTYNDNAIEIPMDGVVDRLFDEDYDKVMDLNVGEIAFLSHGLVDDNDAAFIKVPYSEIESLGREGVWKKYFLPAIKNSDLPGWKKNQYVASFLEFTDNTQEFVKAELLNLFNCIDEDGKGEHGPAGNFDLVYNPEAFDGYGGNMGLWLLGLYNENFWNNSLGIDVHEFANKLGWNIEKMGELEEIILYRDNKKVNVPQSFPNQLMAVDFATIGLDVDDENEVDRNVFNSQGFTFGVIVFDNNGISLSEISFHVVDQNGSITDIISIGQASDNQIIWSVGENGERIDNILRDINPVFNIDKLEKDVLFEINQIKPFNSLDF